MKKTMVELFAGVGGFRLGLEPHGWKTVWANQWEPSTRIQHAYEVYVANFGSKNASNEDINLVDKSTIPDHTLLVGGFPCQDYSVARTKAEGIQGKKGVLWWSIRDTLEAKKPPFFLLENVDRLIKSPAKQRGRDFAVMMRTLHDLGYAMEWRVINAADYGFPQRRRRVFMFGYHKTTDYYKSVIERDAVELIKKDGFFAPTFPVTDPREDQKRLVTVSINEKEYHDLVAVSDLFALRFENAGVMMNGYITTMRVEAKKKKPTTLREILVDDVDEKFYINGGDSRLERLKAMKGAKKEKRVSSSGFEYLYSEGGMSYPDKLDKPARTILTSESSINRSTHIIEDPKTKRMRLLTPLECERLNGFPDNWTQPKKCSVDITDKKRYFFMGNALVVGLIDEMARRVQVIVD